MKTIVKSQHLVILLGMAIMMLIPIGCADQDTLSADEQEIADVITADEDGYFGVGLLAESDPGDISTPAFLAKVDSAIDPRGYGRRVKIWRTGLNIEKSEDGQSAIATVSYRMKGKFIIRQKWTADTVFIFKPIDHRFQRKIRFVKNTDSNAITYWKRDALTPAFGISEGGTMHLTGNIVIRVYHYSSGLSDVFTVSDPLNYFLPFDALPNWAPQDTVTLEIAIANANTSDKPYGIAHRGRHLQPLSRLKGVFHDDGLNGDTVANDGTFTIRWTAINTGITGPHVGLFDFFTTSTIFTSEMPYNSLVVAFPYIKN